MYDNHVKKTDLLHSCYKNRQNYRQIIIICFFFFLILIRKFILLFHIIE